MKRNLLASLALASCLLWGSGCCGFDGCGGHHGCCFVGGGGFSGAGYGGAGYGAAPAASPCACGSAPTVGGTALTGNSIITSDGPVLTSPVIMQGIPGGQPPRIIPVPQANPTPYTP